MSAIAFTLVYAGPNRQVYSATGDAAGTLTYATWLTANAVAGALKDYATALAGTCDSDAKALLAVVGGATVGGALPTGGGIMTRFVATATTASKAGVAITAVDSGAGNNPDIVVTPDGSITGYLIIEHIHSMIV